MQEVQMQLAALPVRQFSRASTLPALWLTPTPGSPILLYIDALGPVLIVDKLCPFGPSICLMGTLQPIWDRKSKRGLIQVLKVNIKRLVPEEAKDTRCPGAGIASGYDLPG